MNIIKILLKEFKQNIRNWKANSMMVLFPIIMIVFLASAFSGVFNHEIDLSSINVQYTVNCSQQLADSFRSFTEKTGKELGISFEETSNQEEGFKGIMDTEYSCYIYLSGDPDEIKIYKNEKYDFEANLVKSILETFSQRYDAIAEIAKSNPEMLGQIMSDTTMSFAKIESLDENNQPESLDYYAVAILTLILMYSSMTGFWSIKSEQTMRTGNRILCAPVRKHEILIGKILGAVAVTVVQAGVVILFSKFILKANFGNDLATLLLLVVVESLMAISMGTVTALLIKNEGAAQGVLNTLIPVVIFFGGGYVPLSVMGEGIERISVISPMKWINDAIFRVIYDSDYSAVPIAILVNLVIAAAFITISAVISKKEAV